MKRMSVLMIALLALGFAVSAQPPAAITSWTIQENLIMDPDAVSLQMGGGVIVSNYMYLCGGWNSVIADEDIRVYAFEINPSTGAVGSAVRMPDLPEDAATALPGDENYSYIHDGVVATDDHIYIHGGSWNGSGASRNVCTYTEILGDGTLTAWSVSSVYPGSYVGEVSVATICENGYLYCIGGWALNDVIYAKIQPDGSLGSWAAAADLPRNANFAAVTSIGNHIILLPGINTGGDTATVTKKVYVCEVYTNGIMGSWVEQTAELPDFVYNGNLEAVGNTLFMVGGRNNGPTPNAETWVWRATFNESAVAADKVSGWTDAVDAQLPYSVRYHEVAYSEQSKCFYVFGMRTDRDGGVPPWNGHEIPTSVVNEVMISSPLFTPIPTPSATPATANPQWALFY